MARAKTAIEVLFEDDHVIAVAKPAGLAAIPGRAEPTCLLQVVARQVGLPSAGTADPRLRVVHRLDKDTSGVMLFAKDLPTQRHLSHQFQNNTIEKEYLAVVVGRTQAKEGSIEAHLGVHPTVKQRMAVLKHGGRPARTDWRVERAFRRYSLLKVFPKTGKTHQIRVHLAHIHHPLAIDAIYNNQREQAIYLSGFKRDYRPTSGEDERPLMERLTLHAHRLSFTNVDGKRVVVEAPVPKDFRALVNQLGRHG
jgi:23S rRNA pseudouridine955/2504/2580 synthase/23S rRNA pseudouridine1911/1915/1917 synthase